MATSPRSREELLKEKEHLDLRLKDIRSQLASLEDERIQVGIGLVWALTQPKRATGSLATTDERPLGRATMETHYEKSERLFGRYRHRAKDLVGKKGWLAYPEYIDSAMRKRSQDTILKEDRTDDEMAGMAVALGDEIVNSTLRKMSDPYDYYSVVMSEDINAFYAWMAHKMKVGSGGNWSKSAYQDNVSTQVAQTWQRFCHEKAGRQVYEVSAGLSEKLRYTKLKGLKTGDIRLPYRSIYIMVPQTLGMRVYNDISGWHAVEGIYITEDLACPEGRTWRFMVVGSSKSETDPWDDALLHFHVTLLADTLLDDAVRLERERHEGNPDIQRSMSKMINEWPDIFRWALNVIMYATWPDAEFDHVMANKDARQLWERIEKIRKDSPKSKKLGELRDRFKQMLPQNRVVLGRGVRLLEVREEMEKRERKLSVRTLVQGHWMRFAVGVGRTERRWQYREPFWRGPKGGDEREGTRHLLV